MAFRRRREKKEPPSGGTSGIPEVRQSGARLGETVRNPGGGQPGVRLCVDGGACLTVKTGNCSHRGDRDYQEDSFGFSDVVSSDAVSNKGILAVLGDGMGGLANGKAISEYVVSSFLTMFDAVDDDAPYEPQMRAIAERINDEVCRNFSIDGRSCAGSTLVAAFVHRLRLYWLCVGDSRLYLRRDGALNPVNEDHDYANQLMTDHLRGDISMADIRADPQKDHLTSFIGKEKLPFIDSNRRGFPLRRNDALILCSDGVYNGISDARILEALARQDPQPACEDIVRQVLDGGVAGQDNLTIMVVEFEE